MLLVGLSQSRGHQHKFINVTSFVGGPPGIRKHQRQKYGPPQLQKLRFLFGTPQIRGHQHTFINATSRVSNVRCDHAQPYLIMASYTVNHGRTGCHGSRNMCPLLKSVVLLIGSPRTRGHQHKVSFITMGRAVPDPKTQHQMFGGV